MAIATLAACYNNPRVFTGVVKIRKGQAVELMMASTNMDNLKCILAQHTMEVRAASWLHGGGGSLGLFMQYHGDCVLCEIHTSTPWG